MKLTYWVRMGNVDSPDKDLVRESVKIIADSEEKARKALLELLKKEGLTIFECSLIAIGR